MTGTRPIILCFMRTSYPGHGGNAGRGRHAACAHYPGGHWHEGSRGRHPPGRGRDRPAGRHHGGHGHWAAAHYDDGLDRLRHRALAVLSGNAGLQLVGQVLGQRSRRKHRPRRARQQHEIGLQRRHRGGHFRVCGRAGRRHPAGAADQRGRPDQPAEHRDFLKRPRRD